MNESDGKIICLLDSGSGDVARVAVSAVGAEIMSATGTLHRVLPMKLRALAAVVSVRFERFAPGEIAVGTRPVNPSDSMYVQGLVDALRLHGFRARAHDSKRAEAWWLIRTLPLERQEAVAICLNLDALSAGDLDGLIAALRQAESELADISQREAEVRAVSAERRREIMKSVQS
jgi:uncharacterized tellurite resistance protein B-like protein